MLKRLSERLNIDADVTVITELKRQIREGEATQLTKSDFVKRRHGKWRCFYNNTNLVVVFDELHNTIMTVYQ